MTAKWLLAALGAAGLALVGYVVEHGELPAWVSELLGLVKDSLTATTPWALWELLLPVLVLGGVAAVLLNIEAAKIKEQGDQIDALTDKLNFLKSHLRDMEKAHSKLKTAHDNAIQHRSTLEATNAELLATNEKLTKSSSSASKTVKPDKLNSMNLNQEQLSAFKFIGERLDSGRDVSIDTITKGLRLSLLTAEEILDALCDLKFVERYDNLIDGESFHLTTAGRSCFLELKRNIPIKLATKHD